MNVQEKEQLIVGTILSCNEEIQKISLLMPKLNENNRNNNLYHFNMVQLFQEINPLFESIDFSNIIPKIPETSIYTKNSRGNYYAYFQKVYNFLDGFEVGLQKSLNENLKSENNVQIDIVSFKKDLKNIILELSKKNDLVNLPKDILKIKILAKKPILIYGFDICNNLELRKELWEKFNIPFEKLLSICFDRSNKQLLFVGTSTSVIIVYDLKTDTFDSYEKINKEKLETKVLTIKDYSEILRDLINNSLIDIYVNINEFKFEAKDNLYYDVLRGSAIQENTPKTSVIKK